MLIIPDLHIGLTWDGLDRTEDIFTILEDIKDEVMPSEPLVFLGDIFDSTNVSHSHVARFINYLAKLRQKFATKIYILAGNHDGQPSHKKGSPLEEVESSRFAEIVWIPKFIPGVGFFIPHTYDELKESDVPLGCDVFTHVDIPGAIPGMEVKIGRGLPTSIPEWLPRKAARVFAGHIHKPQQLGNIYIVGSLILTDLSEVGEQKRIIRTVPNELAYCTIPVANRSLLSLDAVYGTSTYEKAMAALLEELDDTINPIVSVKIMCPHSKAHEVDWIKQEDIIRSKCYYLRWNFNIVKEKELRAKDIDLTKTDGEIIKEYIEKQKLPDQTEVLKCFEEILQ